MELYEIIKMVKDFRGKNETNKTFHNLLQDPNELFLVRKPPVKNNKVDPDLTVMKINQTMEMSTSWK